MDRENAERTVGFQLPRPPLVVHGASFRVRGTSGVGLISCEWGGPYPWPMDLAASMRDISGYFWLASEHMPEDAGAFAWTAEFRPSVPSATWSFLSEGVGEITLYGAPAGVVAMCWDIPPYPTAVVEEAVLIIDAEFPVSVEATSWGCLKALYAMP